MPDATVSVGEASFASAFTNTFKSILGTGVLTMPFAFAATGMYPAIALTILFAVWSFYTSELIARCTDRVPSAMTYDDIAEAAFGGVGRWIGAINLVVNQLLTCCAYLVFASTNFASVFLDDSGGTYPWWFVVAICPPFLVLVCLRNMSSLAPVSAVGNVFVALSLGTILAVAAPHVQWSAFGEPAWPTSTGISTFFGIAAFTFAGQGEVIPIYLSMENRQDYGRVLCGVGFVAWLANVAVGAVVFSAYGDDTQANVFQTLDGMAAGIAKVSMSSVIYATLPLKLFPAVQVMEAILIDDDGLDPSEDEHAPLCPFITEPKRIIIRVFLALVAVGPAMVLSNFGFLVSFSGAFCLGIVGFMLPPLMYIKLHEHDQEESASQEPAVALSASSKAFHMALVAIGTASTIYASTKVVCQQLGAQC